MRHKFQFLNYSIFLVSFSFIIFTSCKKEEGYAIPDPATQLSNDCIKRTLGPNIVSLPIEFAYAMALPKSKGKIVSAQVEASIAGATGTYLENNSYYTNASGVDVPVRVGSPSVNKDNLTSVAFNVDTNAATLRYFYVVPEEARGKAVSFTFSASSSDGATVSYKMGPYTISKMDIKRTFRVSNNNDSSYISIADMAVYNKNTVAANAGKIDLIYLYRATPAAFTHAFVSPAADAQYLPGITLPAGVNRNTKIRKVFNLQDFNLARINVGVFIDDQDFQEINLSDEPNYAIGLKAEAGTWVETADGKYRAYIFLNSVNNNGSAVISMLRYPLQ
ncbi:DUF4466 family protein [Segetibacter aerophilus]|uniref:DUF4466 domain-containing protein n=1 Tax=Segetibacter aerophilus TaxID=670293 RepID=A0A512B9N6_9BACT|nr:DUF4466 family protein [Segetibacter aerophilus]GEO08672.1 hypothetical protein SAE01_11680 [Segetibacter aerophilus]